MNPNTVKINTTDEVQYVNVSRMLNEASHTWHPYETKLTLPIWEMAKKLHYTYRIDRTINDLKTKGFNVLEVVNKLKL